MAKKSWHILLIHQAFVGLEEAGGTRHYEFAQHLAERGHKVTVIASPVSYLTGQNTSSKGTSGQIPNLTVLRASALGGYHRSFFFRLINFLSFSISSFFLGARVRHVDLVWGTSPPIFQAASAWALARIKRVPFLFEVRDLWPAFAVAVGILRSQPLIAATEWLERFLYRRADQLVLNSPGFLQHVRARGGRQISIVPNGADASMFNPEANGAAFRKAHHLENHFVVLYAGAHGISNDLGVVLEAANLMKEDKQIAFVFVGDGKEKPRLQSQAVQMNMENAHFLPPLPKAQMAEALAAADACLAILKPIELYATVYPNKVFDYMAAGRPVLLAIDGVMREVIESAGAGIFVPPGDASALANAIRKLADDPVAARRMGKAGRAYLEKHFDRAELANQMEKVILETAQKKQG